ncbi:MAG: hypothetical protein J7K04_01490 [Spirochaetales bacterium]|nr:hypothetical protein [Spirochaetales bacterium]
MIPDTTKILFITCYSEKDKQFNGISHILNILSSKKESYRIKWQDSRQEVLNLASLNSLENIIISGHGAAERPAVTDNHGFYLTAGNIIVPTRAEVYLLCCFQGRYKILKQWADTLHIPQSRITGCASETETALSTLFFMHLLKYGTDSIHYAFNIWCRMNEYLEPHFKSLRSLYKSTEGDPLKTIKIFTDNFKFSRREEFKKFIDTAREYPEFLEDLA